MKNNVRCAQRIAVSAGQSARDGSRRSRGLRLGYLVLLISCLVYSCGLSEENDLRPFLLDTTYIDFLYGIGPEAVVEITSCNGDRFKVDIKDESVVRVEYSKGDYEYGAFIFTPKGVGTTTVSITDLTVGATSQVNVNVMEPGIAFRVSDTEITVTGVDNSTASSIESHLRSNPAFEPEYTYLLSDEATGIMEVYHYGVSHEYSREFSHVAKADKKYIVIESAGIYGPERKLEVKNDTGTEGEYSYSWFFGWTREGHPTRMNMYPSGNYSVLFSEDLTDHYKTMDSYRDVRSVTVLYTCTYIFTAFGKPVYWQ